jgi:hypothetical protein
MVSCGSRFLLTAVTQLNGPLLPASGPSETLVLELTGVCRQFRKRYSPKFGIAEFEKKVESKGPKRGRIYRTASAFYKGVQTQEHPYL